MTLNSQTYSLPADLSKAVEPALDDWRNGNKVQRLWDGDASLWTGKDENKWLGWLGITAEQLANIGQLNALAADIKNAGFTHALLLGMGGSSLCPEVLSLTFGNASGFPALHVLDSTDPAQVKTRENEIDIAKTIFFVSSKSGGTLEPNIFKQYFFERTRLVVGDAEVGKHFIAITDPGSKMQQVAERDGFRQIFFGLPDIGGRYSALSNFGMAPGAAMGLNVHDFLQRTSEMVAACAPTIPITENPGVALGLILGTAALPPFKRDKVTITASPAVHDLGAWLEQLIAESTGKDHKGLIPVDRERLGPPSTYGKDRIFVYLRLDAEPDAEQDAAIEALEKAGEPVIRIGIKEKQNLGQEFFRWEVATAVAGSLINVNPFDQPDVEASKIATRELTTEFEQTGKLPDESPFFSEAGIQLFTDEKNLAELNAAGPTTLESYLTAHLNRITPGDYFAVLAYLEMTDPNEAVLQELRHAVRDQKHVATCLGFGPRFLHSTGQAYKGGPNSGVFLQITCDDAIDLPVPEQKYSFGIVKAAQARGDLKVLFDRNRRALRVHLKTDVASGLRKLSAAIMDALGYELGKAIWNSDSNTEQK